MVTLCFGVLLAEYLRMEDGTPRGRTNPENKRMHVMWRLGHWALAHHEISWRHIIRHQDGFLEQIPLIGDTAAPT